MNMCIMNSHDYKAFSLLHELSFHTLSLLSMSVLHKQYTCKYSLNKHPLSMQSTMYTHLYTYNLLFHTLDEHGTTAIILPMILCLKMFPKTIRTSAYSCQQKNTNQPLPFLPSFPASHSLNIFLASLF